jgi:hypothetical protein
MAAKTLKLDSLDLDLQNPRITLANDQRDAMQKIIAEQKVKIINLAESIADRGFSPMDRVLVLKSEIRPGKFTVLEGNRRVLCAKLLRNPSLIPTLDMPDAFKKRFQKAAQGFDLKRVEKVDCYEVADRAEGNEWIRRRHQGQDSGRGIVDWSRIASSRFTGRDPAVQALDFVLEHGELADDQKELIAAKFPLSTLDRLLSTPSVRTAIGFEIKNGKLETELPPEEALKPLKRIVLDLSDKTVLNVTALKKVSQQEDYINKLKPFDRANLSKKTGTSVRVEGITNKDFTAKPPPTTKKARAPRTAARTHIVPGGCKLNVTIPKILGIYTELKSLLLSKHVHAISVLLRVFLEMSVDEYLTTKAGSTRTYKDPRSGRTLDKSLKFKVKETIDHMVTNGSDPKDFKGVSNAMTDDKHPFSIDTLHAYIHNRFFTPLDRHLVVGWDNAQPFFEKIWP